MNAATLILLGLILFGAAIGFYSRKNLELPVLKLFPYFLLFQFAYQLAASLYSFVFTDHASNHFIFNLALPVNILYFGMLYHGIIRNPAKRKLIFVGTALNLIFFVINLLFIQEISFLMTYSRTAMSVSLIVYSLLYFHEIVTDDYIENINPVRNASFWIITSIFFFYLSSTLTIIFWNYFVVNNEYVGSVMMRVFAFLLYSMYIAGMLLHRSTDGDS
ncbi:hypothetical protein [Parapedobacter indicus]|uniref:YhhN-like protein n=1 Tax=Parapedobacter indicus TaxID=1477437 RepID=A0A1I3QTY8_9SPHI|nr:hypothetical protein [Parapedobacter indicus]PPL00213.1 hypothetical protein CLV26_10991 [Parapedobacter indicus]SFJ36566.1 hypothetical protein SAMN05444682_10991 [Parapedobacter indicus]